MRRHIYHSASKHDRESLVLHASYVSHHSVTSWCHVIVSHHSISVTNVKMRDKVFR